MKVSVIPKKVQLIGAKCKKTLKTVKEEKEPDNSNNEFSCNKCGKMFSVDNTIQGIHNLSKMLMTHFQNECVKSEEKQSDQDEEMLDQENHAKKKLEKM